jgi:hypothetical protein
MDGGIAWDCTRICGGLSIERREFCGTPLEGSTAASGGCRYGLEAGETGGYVSFERETSHGNVALHCHGIRGRYAPAVIKPERSFVCTPPDKQLLRRHLPETGDRNHLWMFNIPGCIDPVTCEHCSFGRAYARNAR